MRRVLALDTATAWVSAGLVELHDDGSVGTSWTRSAENGKAHGELLAGHIAAVLSDAGCGVADLAAVVVGAGPGPFTGLRVGIVSAATLARLLDRPLYGVCSLDAIAAGVAQRPLLVVTDARRREVYWARYAAGAAEAEPTVGLPGTLETAGCTVVGDGAVQYGLPDARAAHPLPAGLVQCAAARIVAGAAGEIVEPRYLRRPDAVVPAARRSTLQR